MSVLKDIRKLYGGTYRDRNGDNNWELWLDFYRDEAFYRSADTLSLNIPSSVANELAKLATLEFESRCDDREIDEVYQGFLKSIRRFTEYGLALGDVIFKPYVYGEKTAIDVATPDMFVPLSFDAYGVINHIVFVDRVFYDGKYYSRCEEHERDGGFYFIRNRAFVSSDDRFLGDEIELNGVKWWEDFAPEMRMGDLGFNLFGHFKNPQANNLDLGSPMGISCFARALSLIQDADEQYSRIIWEYEGSELAIDADITVLKNGEGLPSGKERLFRNLGTAFEDGFYKVFSPQIRDSSLFNGLNKILQRVEFVCGLAYGTLSDIEEVAKTATEIKQSRQRSYATVRDIQSALEDALRDLVKAMCVWMDFSNGKGIRRDYPEMSFTFDDSIVVDSESEQKILLQEVSAGLIKPEIYLMKRYGVSEEEAKEMLPVVGDEFDNDVDEVE